MRPNPPLQRAFLPVVFWMIGREQRDAEKTIRDLRARIDALEATARARKASAG
jgi:hypothetical protein